MYFKNRRQRGRKHAFTLVELMVVMILIGLLAGLVTVNVRHYLVRGKQSAARVEIARIADAIETFYSVCGRYPTNDEGLAVLTQKTDRIADPLLKQMPIDPWGRPYQYLQPGRNNQPYEVITFGADGREGGDGEDTDISSNNLKENTPSKGGG